MNTPGLRLSVIVPAFNEEKNVPRMVEEISAAVDRLKIEYEVIFIDDGSRDGTFEALKEARRTHPARISARRPPFRPASTTPAARSS
jgi:glycosyltransferase involved in cell wall biosynthesis